MCYCSFVTADGEPCIIPTLYARVGDELLLHGHMHAAMLERLRAGARLAINVTIVDGFVLARAAFHHSANYRSVVIYSKAEEIVDESAKEAASKLIVDSLIPGRVQNSRQATPAELKATAVRRGSTLDPHHAARSHSGCARARRCGGVFTCALLPACVCQAALTRA